MQSICHLILAWDHVFDIGDSIGVIPRKPLIAFSNGIEIQLTQNHYSVYRGHQSSPYYAVSGPGMLQNFYPYYTQYGDGNGRVQAQIFCVQYPPVMQYSCLPQQDPTGILSLPASTTCKFF